MCIDFRKARSDPTETCLHKRENGWQVSVRRHLGVILDNKLCWNENVSCIIQKAITSFLSEKIKIFWRQHIFAGCLLQCSSVQCSYI